MSASPEVRQLTDHLFRRQYPRLVAVLVRTLGLRQVEAAEDFVHEALVAALDTWSDQGVPSRPAAWLAVVAQRKAMNRFRHEAVVADKLRRLAVELDSYADDPQPVEDAITDGTLRMMFACARTDLSREAAIAFVLRTLCGFGPAEIASALGASRAAIEKRLVRARKHLRDHIELDVPVDGSRLPDVLTMIYLVFNEGYKAHGEVVVRRDLCADAINAAERLADSFPNASSVAALVALMHFNIARFDARVDDTGLQVRLFEQDRTRWDTQRLEQAWRWLARSQVGDTASRFHLEAGIVAEYVSAPGPEAVAWSAVVRYFDLLRAFGPSPVRELNRTVAVSYLRGPTEGLRLLDAQLAEGVGLPRHLLLAVRADMLLRDDRTDEAAREIAAARDLAPAGPDRRLLTARAEALERLAASP